MQGLGGGCEVGVMLYGGGTGTGVLATFKITHLSALLRPSSV